jgi:hypothetical protein
MTHPDKRDSPGAGSGELVTRSRQFVLRHAKRLLYRDTLGETGRCMMIAGTGRSGTTWLAEIIATHLNCRLMFEPFNPCHVAAYRKFHYFQYLHPDCNDLEMTGFCDRLFSGRVRGRWIDQEVTSLRPRYRLVKEIRANLLLGWIARRYPEIPLLFIVRHPCAVVESRLKLGWATDSDLAVFLEQPLLVEDHLKEFTGLISATRSDAGKHALVWCISNLIPFRQFGAERLSLVHYEDLCERPEIEVPRVFDAIGQTCNASVFDLLRTPSMSTRGRGDVLSHASLTAGWRTSLSSLQVAEILRIVAAFGLDHWYGDSPTPLSRTRNRERA